MLHELKKIGTAVEDILRQDSFPRQIEPEFLREAVLDYPMRGGKRLRPALAMWACGAVGADPKRALFAAAAVEVWHNWTLVHDDIIDNDDFRRGVPSAHCALRTCAEKNYTVNPERASRFGRDFAILCGDLQQSWATHLLLRSREAGIDADVVLTLAERMIRLAGAGVISGEALDVEVEYRDDATEETVKKILYWKTGALLEFAATAGAMIGLNTTDASHPLVQAVGRFAATSGMAFQLRDDYLGLFGQVETFGKPLGSDWMERKPTMFYLAAMRNGDEAMRKRLAGLFGLETYGAAEIAQIQECLRMTGALDEVLALAQGWNEEARNSLQVLPPGKFRDLLEAMRQYLLEREV